MDRIPCTVEVLTRNSGKTLVKCLSSLREFAEILVIDGNSTDDTLDIARSYGVKVLKQVDTDESEVIIDDFSRVRNIGLAAASHEWFLYIDSDEYLSQEAVREIRGIIEDDERAERVFWLPRIYVSGETIIDRASGYPNRQLRFFHIPSVRRFEKKLHERIFFDDSVDVGILVSPEYVPLVPIEEYREKIRGYARRQADLLSLATPRRQAKSLKANGVKCMKQLVRLIRSYVHPLRGRHMPFSYEWVDLTYFIRISVNILNNLVHKRYS